jgi:hypothetical protein
VVCVDVGCVWVWCGVYVVIMAFVTNIYNKDVFKIVYCFLYNKTYLHIHAQAPHTCTCARMHAPQAHATHTTHTHSTHTNPHTCIHSHRITTHSHIHTTSTHTIHHTYYLHTTHTYSILPRIHTYHRTYHTTHIRKICKSHCNVRGCRVVYECVWAVV